MKLSEFTKSKDFLICIDSDGCALNSLESKHMKCLAPCMITEWELEKWAEAVLARWREVNLYKLTRGINRFQALLDALIEVDLQYKKVDGLGELEYWVETTPEHSHESLKAEIKRTGKEVFKKVLHWSEQADRMISELTEADKKAFEGVKEALTYASEFADIAVISSDSYEAAETDWKMNDLLTHVSVICSEADGSAVTCIAELRKKGYPISQVLMIGDTSADMKAAQKNGVFFFPILVKQEKESWEEFMKTAVATLTSKKYAGPYQKIQIDKLNYNLSR